MKLTQLIVGLDIVNISGEAFGEVSSINVKMALCLLPLRD
jgi:hypothetical protein